MKSTITLLLALFIGFNSFACDEASTVINSVVDNLDGTFTINIDLCAEFNGLEGAPDWFALTFSGGTFTSIVSASPSTVTTTGGDNYNLSLQSGNTQARWTTPSFIPINSSNTFCNNFTIVTNGNPSTLFVNYHDTYGASCEETISMPLCAISGLAAGAQTPCFAGDNSYTQEITVTYNNAPSSGNLEVNGQSFPITTSPQTITLSSLVADGNTVNVTANFSADPTCTLTSNALFTAPAACNSGCNPDNGTWD